MSLFIFLPVCIFTGILSAVLIYSAVKFRMRRLSESERLENTIYEPGGLNATSEISTISNTISVICNKPRQPLPDYKSVGLPPSYEEAIAHCAKVPTISVTPPLKRIE